MNDSTKGACAGYQMTGSNGCTGPACTNFSCNVQTCQSCTGCAKDSDCPSTQWCSGGACVNKGCQTDNDCGSGYFCCQPDGSGNNAACGARWTCQLKGCTSDDSCPDTEYCQPTTWTCQTPICNGVSPCHNDNPCDRTSQTCQNHCCSGACDPTQKPVCADGSEPTCGFDSGSLTFKWSCPSSGTGVSGDCSGDCGTCGTLESNGAGGCLCNDPCSGGSVGCPIGSCSQDSDCGWDQFCSDGCCESDPGGGGGGGGGGCDSGCCDDEACPVDPNPTDPIIIDLSGAGFLMTSAQNGVSFDFQPNQPAHLSWTQKNANVGWLVLDRNGNGKIDNGGELFSNVSPQPNAPQAKNGFRALAVFDQPASGGNRDGWITQKDAIFGKLKIWVDLNHNGISEPSELFTLKQAGIKAISTAYGVSSWVDVYGNRFRYRGTIVWEKPVNGQTTATIYDVILVDAAKK